MARLTQADLAELNKTFEHRTPAELIRWARDMFGHRLAAISAMQQSGCVVCHMLSQLPAEEGGDVPVLFVDTGVMFAETYETRDRIAAEYGITVRTLSPARTMAQQTAEEGVLYLSVDGQARCCHMRKVEPLLAVAEDYDAFMSSLRRSDGGARGQIPILSIDPEMNALRINPLANFTDQQLAAYLAEHEVVINPLHAQGYATIGCNRCTTPVMEGEPKRAGRWRHLGPWSQYCGLNPTDMMDPHQLAVDFDQDLVDRVLGRKTDFVI